MKDSRFLIGRWCAGHTPDIATADDIACAADANRKGRDAPDVCDAATRAASQA
jgi:hypothetical protein